MTNLELLKENSSFLLQPVEKKPYDNSLFSKKIGYQLLTFMYSNDGIGLSANQVGFNHRIFVMGNKDTQCICWNPHILEYSDDLVEKMEGCLSFPKLWLKVRRPDKVTVKFLDSNSIWTYIIQRTN